MRASDTSRRGPSSTRSSGRDVAMVGLGAIAVIVPLLTQAVPDKRAVVEIELGDTAVQTVVLGDKNARVVRPRAGRRLTAEIPADAPFHAAVFTDTGCRATGIFVPGGRYELSFDCVLRVLGGGRGYFMVGDDYYYLKYGGARPEVAGVFRYSQGRDHQVAECPWRIGTTMSGWQAISSDVTILHHSWGTLVVSRKPHGEVEVNALERSELVAVEGGQAVLCLVQTGTVTTSVEDLIGQGPDGSLRVGGVRTWVGLKTGRVTKRLGRCWIAIDEERRVREPVLDVAP